MNKPRKRKFNADVEAYEKRPRKPATFTYEDEDNVTPLLPIKDKRGKVIKQFGKKDKKHPATKEDDIEDEKLDKKPKKKSDYYSQEAIEARAALSAKQRKVQIGHLSSLIVNDPQTNVLKLKALCLMAEETEPISTCTVVRKLSIISLKCIFIDIIPGYKIRAITDEEKGIKLSKEVKKRIVYEEALLRYYQQYLEILERAILSRIIYNKKDHGTIRKKTVKSDPFSLSTISTKSLCDLFCEASHFNYHNNIIKVLVPLLDDRDETISTMTCNAVTNLFRSDMAGERSRETVLGICKMVKSKAAGKFPVNSRVIDTFLSLSIHRVDFEAMAKYKSKKTKEDLKKEGESKKKLSKKQLKHLKKEEDLQVELKEAEATVDRDDKIKINTEIVQEIFLTYFRVLKKRNGHTKRDRLMPSVLEGLSKFAHLINIDFFSDLLSVLQNIVRSGEGTNRQNLCCISTAFHVLSGQGEALNIDPTEFYKYLYQAILYVPNLCHSELANTRRQQRQRLPKPTTESSFRLTQDCLAIMLNKRRKQITLARLLAFAKRLSTVAMQMHPPSNAITMLQQIFDLLKSHSKTYSLFDIESQSNGTYKAEMNDPDRCLATSTCLWEMHSLRRHYCPKVKQKSEEIIRYGQKSLNL